MVESKKLPLCVDDRILTSYSSVGESNIYNTFDLLKYLRWTHRISTEKYFEIYEKIIEHNIQYVLPDREYIYWTLENASGSILKLSISSVNSYLIARFFVSAPGSLCAYRKYNNLFPKNDECLYEELKIYGA